MADPDLNPETPRDTNPDLEWRVAWLDEAGQSLSVDEASLAAIRRPRDHLPEHWIKQMRPGDEIWWFRTDDTTFQMRCGRAGWKLVRQGQVVDFLIVIVN